jgi:hypothetical protein
MDSVPGRATRRPSIQLMGSSWVPERRYYWRPPGSGQTAPKPSQMANGTSVTSSVLTSTTRM